MEFKFRAVDERPPTNFSSTSADGHVSDLALRAANRIADPRQNCEEMLNEIVQREIEKQIIREEIIAAEIARRRELEAEVRRELMMERQLALRGGCGVSFESMRLNPRLSFSPVHQVDNHWLEECLAFLGRRRFHLRPPLPQLPESLLDRGIKSVSQDNKDKVIILAKPDPIFSGEKRKAATAPAGDASRPPFASLKKKFKEEWSCALCQVSVISERALSVHLQGRKHKAKEARLRAEKMAKNASAAPLAKRTAKPVVHTTDTASLKLESKVEGQSLQTNKGGDGSDKKGESKLEVENKDGELQAQKNQNAENLWKIGAATVEIEGRVPWKRNFKFWCEMCQMGAYTEVVMESHKKGKKHLARLQELTQGSATVPTTTTITMAASEVVMERNFKFWCKMCQVGANTELAMDGHKKGKKHLARLQELSQGGATVPTTTTITMEASEVVEGNFKFWCELCQTGAYTEVVMESHKKGKKHLTRLRELSQGGSRVPTTTTMVMESDNKGKSHLDGAAVPNTTTTAMATPEGFEKAKETEVLVNEKTTVDVADNEMITENAVADRNGSASSPVMN